MKKDTTLEDVSKMSSRIDFLNKVWGGKKTFARGAAAQQQLVHPESREGRRRREREFKKQLKKKK